MSTAEGLWRSRDHHDQEARKKKNQWKRVNVSLLLFTRSVVSNSLWPHGLQHTRLPCSLPSPGACSNSSPLSQWCHPTISSSVVSFSSCLLPFPASGSFLTSWHFASGSQRIRVTSKNEWVLPGNCFCCCFNEFFLKKIKLYHYKSFSNEAAVRIRWPKYWGFSSSISPSSDYSGLISIKIDWFDLLAVQETFRNLFTGLIGRVPYTGKDWGQKEKKASGDEAG